eukprot:437225_1
MASLSIMASTPHRYTHTNQLPFHHSDKHGKGGSKGVTESVTAYRCGDLHWTTHSEHKSDKKLMKEYAVLKAKPGDRIGWCFWLPHGTRIYNKLREFISASKCVQF